MMVIALQHPKSAASVFLLLHYSLLKRCLKYRGRDYLMFFTDEMICSIVFRGLSFFPVGLCVNSYCS